MNISEVQFHYIFILQIEKELLELASETDDNGTRSLFSIGKTFEGRDLWAFKVCQ